MWYFSWILGLLLACSLGIINVLRLEAQEALAKEAIALDPLTQLLTKASILQRLREKVENSKRNGSPFSLVFISLKPFTQQHLLPAHELDAILRAVVEVLKQDIRIGLDLAARFDQACFLLALTGAPLRKAEEVARTIQQDVLNTVKTAAQIPVTVQSGAAEYSVHAAEFSSEINDLDHEVQALIQIAQKNCCVV
jgi:cyd operon protein YbgT